MHISTLLALASCAQAFPLLGKHASVPAIRRSQHLTSQVTELQRRPGSADTSSRFLHPPPCSNETNGTNPTIYSQANLLAGLLGSDFLANVSFGNQTFLAVIDTGSSDTWLVESGFACVNQTDNSTIPQADCFFGSSGYIPDSNFVPITDKNFNVSYASGEYLNGILGYDSVTFAGVTVRKQEVALANIAAWNGDGISSGLVGLAFPALTSAFAGTNASLDNLTISGTAPGNHEVYSSLINTIFFVENITSPQFSLALSRDESNTSYGGVIGMGGYPDPTTSTINATGAFASTPIEMLTIKRDVASANSTSPYQFYAITAGGLAWERADGTLGGYNNTATQYIVDSGTTLDFIPSSSAAAVNALFEPPAVLNTTYGLYFVECNATAPKFDVMISGEFFETNAFDMIFPNGDGTCLSGVQSAGDSGPFILGDVFLRNVLAVFDLTPSQYEMHFSPRVYYES